MFRYLGIKLALIASLLLCGVGVQSEGIMSGVAIGGTEGILNAGSTGSGVFTPASIPGLVAWFKADAGTFSNTGCSTPQTTNGGGIGCWADQSGNANNVTQATGGNQPTLATASLNGLSTVALVSASSQQLLLSSFPLGGTGTAFSVFMVVKNTQGGFSRYYSYTVSGTEVIQLDSNNSITSIGFGCLGAFPTQNITGNAFNEIGGICSGTTETAYAAGTAGTPLTGSGSFGITGILSIGATSTGAAAMGGNYAEIVIVNQAMSSANISALHTYFMNRWGV